MVCKVCNDTGQIGNPESPDSCDCGRDYLQLELFRDELPDIEDPPEARCSYCGVVLGDPVLVTIGFCSSECERQSSDD